ncbi:MAG: GtrA family protein [Clostridia bacterium]|nr:GtrA family protein [Clostridia bacterium]
MEKLKSLIKKVWNKEVISYLIFGVLTTLVNILSSYILKAFLSIEENIASTIGIALSILFAYFTNRRWVFCSTANTAKEKWIEFGKFILGRSFTMFIEIVGVFLLTKVIYAFYGLFNDNIAFLINKSIITIIVIILNFFISKFFTFTTSSKKEI